MRNKTRIFIMIGVALIVIVLIYIFLPFLLGKHIQAIKDDTEIETSEWFQNRVQKYDIVRCKLGFTKMEYAFVYENKFKSLIDYHVYFFDITKNGLFSNRISSTYTGGTTIKNTTFPALVKMVKEDCDQFKQGYLDYTGYENLSEQEKNDRYNEIEAKNLGWTHTPFTPAPSEPELTPEEKAKKEAWDERMREEAHQNRANAVPIGDLYK